MELSPAANANQQATTQLPTHKQRLINEFAKRVARRRCQGADALTLQCYRRQEFEKISDAPPLPLSKMSHRQIEGDC